MNLWRITDNQGDHAMATLLIAKQGFLDANFERIIITLDRVTHDRRIWKDGRFLS